MGVESKLFGPQSHYSILGKTSACAPGPAAPSPAADLGWMWRRSGIWEVDEKPHLHIAELPGDWGEQSSSHHGSVARRCLLGWPGMQDRVYASVATWGQAGHFGAGKGFPAHLPGGPAVLPLAPTFSTRFFSTPSGAGSGMLSSDLSRSCSEMPSWVLASSSPCREGHECGWGCKSIAWPRGEIEQCGWVGWGMSVPSPTRRGAQRSHGGTRSLHFTACDHGPGVPPGLSQCCHQPQVALTRLITGSSSILEQCMYLHQQP